MAGKKVESCVNVMVDNLYHAVFCLAFLSTRLGASTCVGVDAICCSVSNVLVSLMVLLCYRRLCYQGVADELYARMNAETSEAETGLESKLSSSLLV